jgi:ABC-2 type transport system permease protein
MSSSWTIAKRELKSLLVSPIAYVVTGFFALASGIYFNALLGRFDNLLNQAQIQAQLYKNPDAFAYVNLNGMVISELTSFSFFLLLFIVPGLTMRLLSEEKTGSTYELLMTSPITAWDITFGKFLGAGIFLALIVATHALPISIMFIYGNPEILPVVSAYIGIILGGLVFLASGLFASSLTKSQIIGFIIALAINIGFLLLANFARTQSGNLGTFLQASSLFTHFQSFNGGLITVSGLVYFATLCAFFLGATTISIHSLTRS